MYHTMMVGAGYHMIMTTEPNCNVSEVDQLLTKHVPEAKLEGELIYSKYLAECICIKYLAMFICCKYLSNVRC